MFVLLLLAGSSAFSQGLPQGRRPTLVGFEEQGSVSAPDDFDDVLAVGEKYGDARILRVEIAGNRRVGADDIRASLSLKSGDVFNAARLSRDVTTLHNLGFFSDIQVRLIPEENGEVTLEYSVTEKPAINEIRIEGNDEIDEEDILEKVDLEVNTPLDTPTVHRNVQNIRNLYSEKGLFLADVTFRLEESRVENAFDVIFVISENAKVTVRKITFVGNEAISGAEINRYMATRTSGPFSFLTD
jgi:outer membrane protein insertion porin family